MRLLDHGYKAPPPFTGPFFGHFSYTMFARMSLVLDPRVPLILKQNALAEVDGDECRVVGNQ